MEDHTLWCVHFSCAIRQHLDRAVASVAEAAGALGRLDPLADLIVGEQHEDAIAVDVEQFAAHALGNK